MKKKLLFTAHSLSLGGIEKALVNLLNTLDEEKYDITLVLERKEGIFLEELPKHVHVIEYQLNHSKNILIRKIKNRLHLWKWKIEHKNKYDFAISFATYSIPGACIALNASKHNALWIHNNYYQLYNENVKEMKKFFRRIKMRKFQHHVYVSYDNMNTMLKYFPQYQKRSIVCNNIIDYQTIRKESEEEISIKKNGITFVNVGRHEEHQKRLSRIIDACDRLKREGYQFQVWFVGDGVNHKKYMEQVKALQLDDVILFLGKQKNPYPYYRLSDAVLLSSKYEGYPVVFVEAMTLNKPIVTTAVSDYREIENKYGIVVENNASAIYRGMKQFLDHSFVIQKPFDPQEFNQQMKEIFENLVEGKK